MIKEFDKARNELVLHIKECKELLKDLPNKDSRHHDLKQHIIEKEHLLMVYDEKIYK